VIRCRRKGQIAQNPGGRCLWGHEDEAGIAVAHGSRDGAMVAALGLVLMGMAFFCGAILLVLAERLSRKAEGK
jgi:hypothetical protein